ncbi:hypothetical protein EDD15DRAFT_2375062 [Pisolithus albus]|nr:hypothetical protein EDD15DRAFT_2375062 [Pisolithus albus]
MESSANRSSLRTHDTSDDHHSVTTWKQTLRLQKAIGRLPSSKRVLENAHKKSDGGELEVTRESSIDQLRLPDDDIAEKKNEKSSMSTGNNCKAGGSEIEFKKPAKGKTAVHP